MSREGIVSLWTGREGGREDGREAGTGGREGGGFKYQELERRRRVKRRERREL